MAKKFDFSWAAEHGPSYDVPDLINFMTKKKVLRDLSWHNDVSPRFHFEDPAGDSSKYVAIWVDHPIGSERECGAGGKRFYIEVANPDVESTTDGDYVLQTDDLEEGLLRLCKEVKKLFPRLPYHPDFDGIVREWKKSIGQRW
jgi:hypothetical protein